ncbi:MAG TPA: CHAD domain-containing protein [Steroidobacteraceae bacterium]|nr:CHAD domain-containing protein [Steroidobacteraceae bacterium]
MADRPSQTLSTPVRPVQQCRDILQRQIGAAVEELQGKEPNVHGARKQLKRARATLRLIREAIGDELYRRENIAARDAARPLSQARDAEVLSAALDGLLERFGPAASGLQVAPLQQRLQRTRRSAVHPLPAKQLGEIKRALKRCLTRAQAWRPQSSGWSSLETGLRATYQRARRALRKARTERATEDLHEWRKQTKYMWHQLQILAPLATGPVGELADEFHHLADYLGDEHDLAVLRERVARPATGLSETTSSALKTLIDRRREELQDKAFALGERLYADKSKAFVHDLEQHWSGAGKKIEGKLSSAA